jgi:uncharacterized protein YuzE
VRISYHSDTDSLYIHLSDIPSAESDEIAQDVVVDYGADGRIVGIEIDHASKLLDLTTLEADSIPIKS